MRREIFTAVTTPVVSLPELVGAFSYALDLTEGQPAEIGRASCRERV